MFKISKEAQEERDKQRVDAFTKEYLELCKKHRLIHIAILMRHPSSTEARVVVTEYAPKPKPTDEGGGGQIEVASE